MSSQHTQVVICRQAVTVSTVLPAKKQSWYHSSTAPPQDSYVEVLTPQCLYLEIVYKEVINGVLGWLS